MPVTDVKEMKQAINNTVTSFLISKFSLLDQVDGLINHLSFFARQAYYAKDQKSLLDIVEKLETTTSRGQAIGQFYKATVLNSRNDKEQANQIWLKLLNETPAPVRAASLLALGLNELQKENYYEANRLIIEASDYALSRGNAPIVYLHAQGSLSLIKSIEGEHLESLKILQGITPQIKAVGKVFPALAAEHCNNCAYEAEQVGQLDLAYYLTCKAVASPYALVNSDWFVTKQDIEIKLNEKRNLSLVPAPEKVFNLDNVRTFPPRATVLHVEYIEEDYHFKILTVNLNNSEECLDFQVRLLVELDNLIRLNPTNAKIVCYILPDETDFARAEFYIDKDSVNDLMAIIALFRDRNFSSEPK